jgi:cobalt-zinc-cadmium efflux system protein
VGVDQRCHSERRGLAWTAGLMAAFVLVEAAGGFAANSLALLSDAGHMFTDVLSLCLALFAVTMATRPPHPRATFGYYRLEILAALLNGVLLILIAFGLGYEAYVRFLAPPPVAGELVLVVAAAGLAANLAGLAILRRSGRGGLNVRGALMHVLSDTLSSVAVLAGGAVITFTGWYAIDPILSATIAVGIVIGAVRLLREAVDVLLESSPAGLDLSMVRDEVLTISGVRQVHDLHVWSITSGMTALSGHVVLDATTLAHSDSILNSIKTLLKDRYCIEHTTIQVESETYEEVGEVHGERVDRRVSG